MEIAMQAEMITARIVLSLSAASHKTPRAYRNWRANRADFIFIQSGVFMISVWRFRLVLIHNVISTLRGVDQVGGLIECHPRKQPRNPCVAGVIGDIERHFPG